MTYKFHIHENSLRKETYDFTLIEKKTIYPAIIFGLLNTRMWNRISRYHFFKIITLNKQN